MAKFDKGSRLQSEYSIYKHICPICKKKFYVEFPLEWVYRRRDMFFCTYGCMRKYDKRIMMKRAEKPRSKYHYLLEKEKE